MQIISKKRFQFIRSEIVENPANPNEKFHKILETCIVEASTNPQVAPDWIREDGLFALAKKDKSLMVVIVENEESEEKEEKPKKTASPATPPATGLAPVKGAQGGWTAPATADPKKV